MIVLEPKKKVVKDKQWVGGRYHSRKKGKKEVLEVKFFKNKDNRSGLCKRTLRPAHL